MTAILAAAALATGLPTQGELLLKGRIIEIRPEMRLVIAETDSIIDSEGAEVFADRPEVCAVKIPDWGSIRSQGSLSAWMRLEDLSVNDPLSAYIHADQKSAYEPFELAQIDVPNQNPSFNPADAKVARDRVCGESTIVPLVFPVSGKVRYSDTFLAPRGGGKRRHHGQDLMAEKMTPLVAAFDGVVTLRFTKKKNSHNWLTLKGDGGWSARYMHLNNDTPGTDDGLAPLDQAFAPGLSSGDRVRAGQIIGYVGDSGNAENTGPHLHFELWNEELNAVFNAYPSLKKAHESKTELQPLPDWSADEGEMRVDGLLQAFDGETLSIQKPSGESLTLKVSGTALNRWSRSRLVLAAREDFQAGRQVIVMAKNDQAMQVVIFDN
jgi:murein DD-endopeptidase MepM/ murein hydrolase activator NlpD